VLIKETDNYVLERTPVQGYINLRWPFTRFNFLKADALLGSVAFASHIMCSFVKDQTMYQILRITPAKPLSPLTSSLSLPDTKRKNSITITVGGVLRFGCFSSAHGMSDTQQAQIDDTNANEEDFDGAPPPFLDQYTIIEPPEGQSAHVLAIESGTHGKRLEIRVWANRESQELKNIPNLLARLNREDDNSAEETDGRSISREVKSLNGQFDVQILDDQAINVVASFSLVSKDQPIRWDATDMIRSLEVEDYLGVLEYSTSAPYRLWSNVLGKPDSSDSPATFELNSVGRSIESILGVLSMPIKLIRIESNGGLDTNNISLLSAKGKNVLPLVQKGKRLPAEAVKGQNGRRHYLQTSINKSSQTQEADVGIALIKSIVDGQEVDLELTL
jgi:hypothetical protein